jgi:hypothetical protein
MPERVRHVGLRFLPSRSLDTARVEVNEVGIRPEHHMKEPRRFPHTAIYEGHRSRTGNKTKLNVIGVIEI